MQPCNRPFTEVSAPRLSKTAYGKSRDARRCPRSTSTDRLACSAAATRRALRAISFSVLMGQRDRSVSGQLSHTSGRSILFNDSPAHRGSVVVAPWRLRCPMSPSSCSSGACQADSSTERPTDPYVRRCGSGGVARHPRIPISRNYFPRKCGNSKRLAHNSNQRNGLCARR
jgi:hypothetical protein